MLYGIQGATDMIIGIGIGRFIGIADMGNAYRLSVSADKKAHIGSLGPGPLVIRS